MKKLLLIFLVFSQVAVAGSNATQHNTFNPEDIVSLAKYVEHYAAQQGARAFIIGRVGRPKDTLPKGIAFTHTAIAVYSTITLSSGETVNGYAIHNLYQTPDNPDRSMLVTDYPVDFFWGAQALEAGIIIPRADVQLALAKLVTSEDAKRLHNMRYSAIANPFNTQYQNCTEYTLDLINSVIYGTLDTSRLKRNATAYFDPQIVHKSRLYLKLGSAFTDGVTTRDHKGKVKTATFSTIAHYLHEYGLVKDAVTIDSNKQIAPLI